MGGTIGISHDIGPGAFNVSYSLVNADWDDAERDGVTLVNTGSSNEFLSAYDEERELVHINYQ